MITALVVAAVVAQPAYQLDGSSLTVTGASLAHVSNAFGGSGERVELVQGAALGDPSFAGSNMLETIVWELAPGDYSLIAWGEFDDVIGGFTSESWTITVADPAREELIRQALIDWIKAWAVLRELAPTPGEIEAALGL